MTQDRDGEAWTFSDVGDFVAYRRAKAWLEGQGYSVGRMQAHAPSGVLRGDYDIQKWRNLRPHERAALDGTVTGNFRHGPVVVRLAREGR